MKPNPHKIWVPARKVEITGRVQTVLINAKTGAKDFGPIVENIVNDQGDLFYAYRSVLEQPPDNLFTTGAALAFDGIMELYKSVSAAPSKGAVRSGLTGGVLITGSAKVIDATYPLRNDPDGDNTGAGADIATYRVTYTTGEANDTFDDVILTNPSPSAGDNLLMWADGLARTKTSSDILKVFINHRFNGV